MCTCITCKPDLPKEMCRTCNLVLKWASATQQNLLLYTKIAAVLPNKLCNLENSISIDSNILYNYYYTCVLCFFWRAFNVGLWWQIIIEIYYLHRSSIQKFNVGQTTANVLERYWSALLIIHTQITHFNISWWIISLLFVSLVHKGGTWAWNPQFTPYHNNTTLHSGVCTSLKRGNQ